MRIRFIFPSWGEFPLEYRNYLPTLGLITVAGLTPPQHEVRFTDERIETVNLEEEVEVVAVSAMTAQIGRAYELADHFRARGIKVVLGGAHPSVMPEEALQHADAVVIGEAEGPWQKLLEDLERGELQKIYRCSQMPDLQYLGWPRRELLEGKGYLPVDPLQTTRGCPLDCDFCSVTQTFGKAFRMRPIEYVVDELKNLDDYVFIVDDNMILNKKYSLDLFQGMAPLNKKWTGLGTIKMAEDENFLRLLAHSGCWLLYLDLGPWLSMGLNKEGLKHPLVKKHLDYLGLFHKYNIKVIGSFVFGFDHDTPSIFEHTVAFAKAARMEEVEFLVLTPYPKTRLWAKLEEERRIFDYDWKKYNTAHVVYRPQGMSPQELQDGYAFAWEEFYRGVEHSERLQGLLFRTIQSFPL